ncbi:hypothetical protein Tsp_07388 [Trichinella spiralis]|uniref:hypothetical protein n=1 Tax=Trichinella spiralis TaxID=6334 RepID=UPI0001EFCB31|nr:hypothetical protein Tsp_07388 [Trichinella spiralis]
MGSTPTLPAQSRIPHSIINNNNNTTTNNGSWPFVGRLVDCEKLTTVHPTVQRLVRSKPRHYNNHAHKSIERFANLGKEIIIFSPPQMGQLQPAGCGMKRKIVACSLQFHNRTFTASSAQILFKPKSKTWKNGNIYSFKEKMKKNIFPNTRHDRVNLS